MLIGCAAPNTPDSKPSALSQSATINYTDAVHGLHLEYPDSWTERALPGSGQVLLLLELPGVKSKSTPATLMLISQPAESGAPPKLPLLVQAAVRKAQQQLDGFELMEQSLTILGGARAQRIVYRGQSDGVPLQTLCVITVHNSQGFALSYAGDPADFETNRPAVEKVIASFAWN